MERFMYGDSLFSGFTQAREFMDNQSGKWYAEIDFFSNKWIIEQDLNVDANLGQYFCESYFLLYPDYYKKYEHPNLRLNGDEYDNYKWAEEDDPGVLYQTNLSQQRRIQLVWDNITPSFSPLDNTTFFVETLERVRLFYKSQMNLTLKFDIFYVKDESITRCPEKPLYIQEAMENMLIQHKSTRMYEGTGVVFIYGCDNIINNITTITSKGYSLVRGKEDKGLWVVLVHAIGHLLGAKESGFYDNDNVMNFYKLRTANLGPSSKEEISRHKEKPGCRKLKSYR